MRSVIAVLLSLLLAAFGRAQERSATVRLDDGRVLNGRVMAMDLTSLRLQVDGEVLALPTAHIVEFHFATQLEGSAAAASPDTPAAPAGQVLSAETAPQKEKLAAKKRAASAEPIATDEEAVPHDLRNRSLWQQRIEVFDARYRWLSPAAPTQWISLGLLLFAALSLMCHLSVRVSGAEDPSFPRCMGLALWYLVSAILQVALVPAHDVAVVIMLLANPALAVFWLRTMFGMTRPATLVALAVQLGFAVVGFGVLALVDALLASTGSNPS